MNKIFFKIFIWLFIGSFHSQLSSLCFENCYYNSCWNEGWAAEFRVAYFSPESKKVKKIYSHHLVDYELEFSKQVYPNFSIWLDIDYLSKKGESYPLHDRTRLTLVPLALGLNYQLFCFNNWQAYCGAGATYTYLHIHDHSSYVKKHIHKWDLGGLFKLGVKKVFCNGITLGIFCDYFLQKFHFSNHSHCFASSSCTVKRNNLNISGLKVGAGIGYTF